MASTAPPRALKIQYSDILTSPVMGLRMPVVTWDFKRAETPYRMLLEIDESRPNERLILDFMKAGMFYEPDEASVLLRVLKPGDVVADVGANIGFFSVLAGLLVGDSGHVIAFEPESECRAKLAANVERNDLRNVVIKDGAATDCDGPITLYINSDNAGGNALWDPGAWPGMIRAERHHDR